MKMKTLAVISTVISAMVLMPSNANAENQLVNASLNYVHDTSLTTNKDAIQTEISISPSVKDDLRFGMTGTFKPNDVKNADLQKYGAFVEQRIAVTQNISILPRFGISEYKNDDKTKTVDLSLAGELKLTNNLYGVTRYTYVTELNQYSDYKLPDNSVYTLGVSYKF